MGHGSIVLGVGVGWVEERRRGAASRRVTQHLSGRWVTLQEGCAYAKPQPNLVS